MITKPIAGIFSAYTISEDGTVMRDGKVRKTIMNDQGYLRINLSVRGQIYTRSVHRLVALTFIGAPPEGKTMVCHRDGSRQHNHWSNLYWGTAKDNADDRRNHAIARGERHHMSKLADEDIRAIRASSDLQADIAAHYGVAHNTIWYIKSGKTWKHVI